MEHVNGMYTRRITNCMLSAKRIKIDGTSNEEMGGKYETLMGHVA
jgi:hypothetical protein